jgi:oligopeptide/dipeptide ABC transporter ATP-binding protein
LRRDRIVGANQHELQNIVNVKGLKKYFPIHRGFFKRVAGYTKAVDGVDFYIKKGETVGLVGESGSGKTTVGRCIVRLYQPTEGTVEFLLNGEMRNLLEMDRKELKECRRHFQMLFQDPYSSLNARLTIGDIVAEPLVIHDIGAPNERLEMAKTLLERVGLSADQAQQYPHQFSGGQRQRIGIARALSINPDLIICDEPVSALDVSVQAQVLNLLSDLQEEFDLSYLFIAHDLSVVEYISDRIMVMYLGKIVEVASSETIYREPKHPYTEALLAAISKYEAGSRRKILVHGSIPDPANPPPGCVFHSRCQYAKDICKESIPNLEPIEGEPESFIACHRYGELDLKGYI